MPDNVRVRFAPSPTGPLHLGGLRTALYNYLFAKKYNGTFILRIEDTDRTRFVPNAERYIRKSLEWCGIEPDESPWGGGPYGPYRQTERHYRSFVDRLVDAGLAYYAFDTVEDLAHERERNPSFSYNHATRKNLKNSLTMSSNEVRDLIAQGTKYVVRFKVDPGKTIDVTDEIRGDVRFRSYEVDDKVILKADGIPTYHLASVVDDQLMKITHVIRGEEWLPSLPFHVMLYDALGFDMPRFAHLPLIMNPNGKGKLSKRMAESYGFSVFPLTWFDGEKEVEGYMEAGYDPNAFINFLAMLGWSPRDNKEIMSVDEMSDEFDLGRVKKSGAMFDIEKLKWFNSVYVRNTSNDSIIRRLNDDYYTREKLEMIAEMSKKKAIFVSDIEEVTNIFFYENDDLDPKSFNKSYFEVAEHLLNNINEDTMSSVLAVKKGLLCEIPKKLGIKPGLVMGGLRQALMNGIKGPDIGETMYILGPELTKSRIRKTFKYQ